jgi:hypothetical protein
MSAALRLIKQAWICCAVFALGIAALRPACAQDAAGTGHLKSKINAEFSFPAQDWSFHNPGSDYFSDFKDMRMNLYASSAGGCSIDMFAMLDGERLGFIGTYMVSLQDFFDMRGAETDEQYEVWRGDRGKRVVGKLLVQGPADKTGAMHSRNAGTAPYRNVIYMILNNMNLMRLAFSAPVNDWSNPECTARIDRVVNSFLLKGEPDTREERVLTGMASRITADRTSQTPGPAVIDNGQSGAGPGHETPPAATSGSSETAGQIQALHDKIDALTVRLSVLESGQEKLLKKIDELTEQLKNACGTQGADQ